MPQPATAASRVLAREREQKAFELRKSGRSYSGIATELGVTPQAAHKMVKRVMKKLAKLTEADAEDIRRIEVERLDAMLAAIWEKAKGGGLGALDRVLSIMRRRADLLGLDAAEPAKGTGGLVVELPLRLTLVDDTPVEEPGEDEPV